MIFKQMRAEKSRK